jgi:tRNA-binding EMAP/Myf-like protein
MLQALLAVSPSSAALLGSSAVEQAEVLNSLQAFPPGEAASKEALASLEARLLASSYVAGPRLTIADAVAVHATALAGLSASELAQRPALARWLDQVYHEQAGLTAADEFTPAQLQLPARPALDLSGEPAGSGSAAAAAPAAAAPAEKKKGGSGPKAPAPAPAPAEAASPLSEMDFAVGVITEAWAHPDSDKLWCEKISFGPGEPVREIASGLRAFFTQEQMTGQRVVVVRNLKPRKLAGFLSSGELLVGA